jgi:EAL domain-containing protein (putative c-di-GMP-specific phosphodiesterase class I)/FixJ family two-component response regulator
MAPPVDTSAIVSLLIVDDNPVQRMQVAALCRELGVPMIYEAGSGKEALDLMALLVLPPDLVIVDLEMPAMDGVEFIECLHQRGLDVPLVVASSREVVLIQTVETMARNLGMPVLAALRKPLRPDQLRAAFERWNRERRDDGTRPSNAVALEVPREELARAIADGAITVWYQPKVDMARGVVTGVEALSRWTHPQLGRVNPERFVALAEREGLIRELTFHVLRMAVAQAARWNALGLTLSLAVNLSPTLLEVPGLVQRIVEIVEREHLPPRQLVLEITESSVVDCMGAALGVLARLRLHGFGLSIDDYGTGFSSMQQLARIPFSELKIDRSFVHCAHLRANLRVILQSALTMARQLGLVTVAEGIETVEDWCLVRDSGCTLGQGWLVAPALPGEELPNWIRAHEPRVLSLGNGPRPQPGAAQEDRRLYERRLYERRMAERRVRGKRSPAPSSRPSS